MCRMLDRKLWDFVLDRIKSTNIVDCNRRRWVLYIDTLNWFFLRLHVDIKSSKSKDMLNLELWSIKQNLNCFMSKNSTMI